MNRQQLLSAAPEMECISQMKVFTLSLTGLDFRGLSSLNAIWYNTNPSTALNAQRKRIVNDSKQEWYSFAVVHWFPTSIWMYRPIKSSAAPTEPRNLSTFAKSVSHPGITMHKSWIWSTCWEILGFRSQNCPVCNFVHDYLLDKPDTCTTEQRISIAPNQTSWRQLIQTWKFSRLFRQILWGSCIIEYPGTSRCSCTN